MCIAVLIPTKCPMFFWKRPVGIMFPAFTFYQRRANQFLRLFILKIPRDAGKSVIATKENPGLRDKLTYLTQMKC